MTRLFCMILFPVLLAAGTPEPVLRPTATTDGWFAKDKAQHAVVSFIMTGFSVYQLRHDSGKRADDARWGGTMVTVSLGLGKEFMDRRNPKNHFCFKDLAADGLGIAAALVLVGKW